MISQHITVALEVNGQTREVSAMADTPLLLVLRNDLELNGPKYGCGLGECGACTVIIDGVAARACVFPLSGAGGARLSRLKAWARARRRTRCNKPLSMSRPRNVATASTA